MNKPHTTETTLEALVRRIVNEVLAGTEIPKTNTQSNPDNLCLKDAHVIAVADVEGKLDGKTQVTVADKAVVTPAARDLLRQNGVAIQRGQQPNLNTQNQAHETTIGIADVDSTERAISFAKQLQLRSGQKTEVVPAAKANLVLADVPHAVVSKRCRENIEAAQVGAIDEVERVRTAMQPELWVLDMTRLNLVAAVNVAAKCVK